MQRMWIGFVPYLVMSAVHVGALAAHNDALAAPTKLWLMPLLAAAVAWGLRGRRWHTPDTLLIVAILLSWLGDGAATFFSWAPTVPLMLLWFGLAHLCYIWLFSRYTAQHRVPPWAIVFAMWWGVLLAVLWPHLGGLLVPVALYGLVLGGTATAASRCGPLIASGGVFFLASDSVLAFRLFLPEAMPDWTSPVVMATYTLGQGLMAAGVVLLSRAADREQEKAEVSG